MSHASEPKLYQLTFPMKAEPAELSRPEMVIPDPLVQTAKVWKERRREEMWVSRSREEEKEDAYTRQAFPLWWGHPGGQQMGAVLGFQETHDGNQENSLGK